MHTVSTNIKIHKDKFETGWAWREKRVEKRVKQTLREAGFSVFREFWPFHAFGMLKTTFSKHWLIKSNVTFVYMKTQVYVLIFNGKEMTLLIGKNTNLLKDIFLMREMRKFLVVWSYSSLSPYSGFPTKVWGTKVQSTLSRVNKATSKEQTSEGWNKRYKAGT